MSATGSMLPPKGYEIVLWIVWQGKHMLKVEGSAEKAELYRKQYEGDRVERVQID